MVINMEVEFKVLTILFSSFENCLDMQRNKEYFFIELHQNKLHRKFKLFFFHIKRKESINGNCVKKIAQT